MASISSSMLVAIQVLPLADHGSATTASRLESSLLDPWVTRKKAVYYWNNSLDSGPNLKEPLRACFLFKCLLLAWECWECSLFLTLLICIPRSRQLSAHTRTAKLFDPCFNVLLFTRSRTTHTRTAKPFDPCFNVLLFTLLDRTALISYLVSWLYRLISALHCFADYHHITELAINPRVCSPIATRKTRPIWVVDISNFMTIWLGILINCLSSKSCAVMILGMSTLHCLHLKGEYGYNEILSIGKSRRSSKHRNTRRWLLLR